MATSAFAGAARNSFWLRISRRTFNVASSSRASPGFRVVPSATLWKAALDRSCEWPPSAMLIDRESADHSRILAVTVGIFGALGLAMFGVRNLHEDAVRFDTTELQRTTSEDIEKSSVMASKKYNLLADSYRRQVFFNYERRIRLRSRPEKVFGYFASHRDSDGQPYMTPADLMRAVVPIFPPSGSTIIREGHLEGERSPGELSCAPSEFFMLFDTNGDGLISFAEYIFFVTLLSISEKNLSTAFKMFDLNGNGCIDRDEFKEVIRRMRERTRQGLAHQKSHIGLKVSSTSVENGGLVEFFFGKEGKKLLRHEDFEKFLRQLHEEIIRLEFAHYDFQQKGTISAHDFSLSMIAAADMDLLNNYLERAALLKDPQYKELQISPEEFYHFAELRKKLPKLARAMSNYGAMSKADFQRAASQVCHVPLSSTVVDIVFHIFDANQDGYLSSEEFLHAMERRENDIANPKETGVVYIFKCWWRCVQSCQSTLYHNNWRV